MDNNANQVPAELGDNIDQVRRGGRGRARGAGSKRERETIPVVDGQARATAAVAVNEGPTVLPPIRGRGRGRGSDSTRHQVHPPASGSADATPNTTPTPEDALLPVRAHGRGRDSNFRGQVSASEGAAEGRGRGHGRGRDATHQAGHEDDSATEATPSQRGRGRGRRGALPPSDALPVRGRGRGRSELTLSNAPGTFAFAAPAPANPTIECPYIGGGDSGIEPESYLHGSNVAAIKRNYPVTEVADPVNLLDLGVVIADVIAFLPINDQVPFLASSVEVHQWYDTCVEFRMAVAYTDAPYRKGSNGIVESWYRSLPSSKPRWDYAPINFKQDSAGYLLDDELAPSQRKSMKVVPDVSYFNLRSLCCSTMVSKASGLRAQAGKLRHDDDTKGDDYYDATNSLDAGSYLLAGLVANHVVIKSTGGISSIGRGFLRSTTAHTVTIAADRYTGSNVCAPKSIGSGWFGDCKNLRLLDCAGLDYVESIGDRWLERSGELESVSFTGLRNLKTVGESWLHACPKLTHVDFSGLGKLETVSGWWLRECRALETIDFKGLVSLKSVGHRWLEQCVNLKHVDKSGLPASFKESAALAGW